MKKIVVLLVLLQASLGFAQGLQDTIKGGFSFDVTKVLWQDKGLAGYHKDTIFYPRTGIGDSHCATIYYFITGDSSATVIPVTITGSKLGGTDGSFTMTSLPSALPVLLRPKSPSHPADTFQITVCFNSKDTGVHFDTMTLSTAQSELTVKLFGQGATPLITATDYDFGNVLIGSSNCTGNSKYGPSRITIKNVGKLPFMLTSQWVMTNIIGGKEFTMDKPSATRLPYTLWPSPDPLRRDTINLYFCYTPTDLGPDSSIVTWNADITPPFANQVKPWSYLKGNGVRPGLYWDWPDLTIYADSIQMPAEVVGRVHLYANATSVLRLEKVFFTGPEASEFKIVGDQFGLNPLEGVDLAPGDTIWVDIAFTPDYTKPYPQKFADRHANLDVIYFTDAARTQRDTNTIKVMGTFTGKLSVAKPASNTSDLKAYISNHQLIIELPEGFEHLTNCSLYDILGRKIKTWEKTEMQLSGSTLSMPMPQVTSGAYIVRVGLQNSETSSIILIQKEK